MAAGAVGAGAAGAALALAVVLRGLLHLEVALLGVDHDDAVAVALLHALGLVGAVAVAALVSHGGLGL